MMETLSETEYAAPISGGFIPKHFVCIDRFFNKKMEILANYQDEIFKHPFPRSETAVRSQCQIRGTMANCQFAEAFMVVKEIIR